MNCHVKKINWLKNSIILAKGTSDIDRPCAEIGGLILPELEKQAVSEGMLVRSVSLRPRGKKVVQIYPNDNILYEKILITGSSDSEISKGFRVKSSEVDGLMGSFPCEIQNLTCSWLNLSHNSVIATLRSVENRRDCSVVASISHCVNVCSVVADRGLAPLAESVVETYFYAVKCDQASHEIKTETFDKLSTVLTVSENILIPGNFYKCGHSDLNLVDNDNDKLSFARIESVKQQLFVNVSQMPILGIIFLCSEVICVFMCFLLCFATFGKLLFIWLFQRRNFDGLAFCCTCQGQCKIWKLPCQNVLLNIFYDQYLRGNVCRKSFNFTAKLARKINCKLKPADLITNMLLLGFVVINF